MKNSKIVALVATAALLVLGAAFTAFAYGWTEEAGTWRYYDKDGELVTEEFRKSGNDWYWLDENGDMATETLVDYNDSKYYVDASGKMVKNNWVSVENTDNAEGFEDTIWYYFQASGKSYKTRKATVNGKKYVFDDEGRMLFGWLTLDDSTNEIYTMVDKEDDNSWKLGYFYAGSNDDGELRINKWEKLEIWDADADEIGGADDSAWFFFNNKGRKLVEEDGIKTINGKKYIFDENGKMQYEWAVATPATTATGSIQGYEWFQDAETGARLANGWFRTVPNKVSDATASWDDESHWFYAKGDGELVKRTIKTIGGKPYAFGENGEMLSGLYWVDYTAGEYTFTPLDTVDAVDSYATVAQMAAAHDKTGIAYFGDEETDGSMKTGTVNKIDVDGEEYSFKFYTKGTAKGRGVNGKDGNYYYLNGKKVAADGDVKYQLYRANKGFGTAGAVMLDETAINAESIGAKTFASNENYWLISSTGAVIKSGTKKDGDGWSIVVKNGRVTEIKE